ncbi:hypothetical protein PCC8801_3877 [Rippkaea orientalis PCC 8801]|uniref:Spore protein YkvP/CgeB glycosyl transferase-like domain-containing protein n=1 Tax=Rippkaea orientalis (strain PCC 8801 / RF-1) TaxID=41431 RepID=B7K4C0_RIPO1|nr:glycosyltransferase [Rippkaea orientalis]ACK67826.1 hypothetical protein PCC8801_3877 [Rippkaea orientalis PCC 8801]
MKKVLFLGKRVDTISQAQYEPFIYYRQQLLDELNLTIKYLNIETLNEIKQLCQKYDSEIVFIQPFWREKPDEVEMILREIRSDYPDRKLIFIDPWSQASSKYFKVLPYVDKFLKRQCYKNRQDYHQKFIGGSRFTHFLANTWNLDFEQWYVGSEVPQGYEERIMPGWNLGTAKRYKKALQRSKGWLWSRLHPKNIDVFCRMSFGNRDNKEWYYEYRKSAIDALDPLSSNSNYRVAISGSFVDSLVPNSQYQREIKSSKIVVSPFGWGEGCWRDFEAVCYDCLLIKPSMAHLETDPNIFIEGETYVAVNWDFSDVVEKCLYYLEHNDEAQRIIKNARRVYEHYFENTKFVQTIKHCIY